MSPKIGLSLSTLLQTAADMADAKGLERVSLASLARELGVRSPSLYNHVDGLPDLRTKLAVHGYRLLHGAMIEAVVGRSGDDAVHRLGDAYLPLPGPIPGCMKPPFAPIHGIPKWKRRGGPLWS
ncbi:transcriptional regulator, TetR family [Kroppenstedtia eburnea]|uniref:Transcriptional regulator, TetR family n=1 Tax=Kroppenstedtia eburnea TaxID=714067 RepID=A0A1N7P6R6_9BACL|nr:transcriptional regulator, TetR family [Kroppenstedtia eburnea]